MPRFLLPAAAALLLCACTSEPPPPPPKKNVLDAHQQALQKAKAVQDTVDARKAETDKRLQEAEKGE